MKALTLNQYRLISILLMMGLPQFVQMLLVIPKPNQVATI